METPFVEGDTGWVMILGGMPRRGVITGFRVRRGEFIGWYLGEREYRAGDVYGSKEEALNSLKKGMGGRVARELLAKHKKNAIDFSEEEIVFLKDVCKKYPEKRGRASNFTKM